MEFVSSVKAASHKVRDAAARMIVGSGMLLLVAAIDVGLRLDVTISHSAMILLRVLAAASYMILWMLLVHQRVAEGAYQLYTCACMSGNVSSYLLYHDAFRWPKFAFSVSVRRNHVP